MYHAKSVDRLQLADVIGQIDKGYPGQSIVPASRIPDNRSGHPAMPRATGCDTADSTSVLYF
ncbi:hypothetical protein LBCZ_0786 [Lacticaseibacillus casei DSM 20011 = JCM 1134 = ATCC 393]|uniref:Uncharacterized protein n=1 Tax=Lacticaseibacillus casei DSM 20011 = JCM 1134 = ATCC 393 TaxID=1423732 RepID=A0AAD1ES74_LACCA|nr:hypothetical protein LBCZ_0786 [Lacticaseibacillus casei DSM 20011 = JCM 1134 = ATCC 393]